MATINMEYKLASAPKSMGRQLVFAAGTSKAVTSHILEPHGLTLAQWAVLSCLWRNGPLGIKDIARLTGNASPAVSRIVDRMVDAGLLVRESAKDDRRSVKVDLTESAENQRHLQQIYKQVNGVLLRGLSEAEIETLYRLLSLVENNGKKWLEDEKE